MLRRSASFLEESNRVYKYMSSFLVYLSHPRCIFRRYDTLDAARGSQQPIPVRHAWHGGVTNYQMNMQAMTQTNPDSMATRRIRQVIIIPDDAPAGFADVLLAAAGL